MLNRIRHLALLRLVIEGKGLIRSGHARDRVGVRSCQGLTSVVGCIAIRSVNGQSIALETPPGGSLLASGGHLNAIVINNHLTEQGSPRADVVSRVPPENRRHGWLWTLVREGAVVSASGPLNWFRTRLRRNESGSKTTTVALGSQPKDEPRSPGSTTRIVACSAGTVPAFGFRNKHRPMAHQWLSGHDYHLDVRGMGATERPAVRRTILPLRRLVCPANGVITT
jgi:hypothetical protein